MPASFLSLTGWNDVFHEVLNHLERPVDDVHDNEDYDGEIYRAALSTFRNALLSLALSCRAFLDPSLDKLWHDLHDILPLLELLPNYERRGRVHIERLDLSHRAPVDETLLIRFAKLENLAQLQVTACFPNSTDSPPLDRRHSFQKLTKLELRCQPTGLARFILASTMPRLNDLYDFLKHFPSICRHIGPHTLTRLRVELGEISLELFFEEHLPLRDADIERLARAWSNQHNLILIQSETTMSDPDRLARGCPQLSKICIPDLDATSVPPADSVPLTAHGARKLCIQNLVGAGEDETRLAVAVVLDRLFPRLKLEMSGIMEMPGYGDSPNPYVDDSESVTLLLRAMQIARKHYPGGV
ncbi:hypothetical protein V8D89_001138 [Ganoderma adspersum]